MAADLREIVEQPQFREDKKKFKHSAKRLDEILEGIVWTLARLPECYPNIPGTNVYLAKTDSVLAFPLTGYGSRSMTTMSTLRKSTKPQYQNKFKLTHYRLALRLWIFVDGGRERGSRISRRWGRASVPRRPGGRPRGICLWRRGKTKDGRCGRTRREWPRVRIERERRYRWLRR